MTSLLTRHGTHSLCFTHANSEQSAAASNAKCQTTIFRTKKFAAVASLAAKDQLLVGQAPARDFLKR